VREISKTQHTTGTISSATFPGSGISSKKRAKYNYNVGKFPQISVIPLAACVRTCLGRRELDPAHHELTIE
jgi:hypothetical protein